MATGEETSQGTTWRRRLRALGARSHLVSERGRLSLLAQSAALGATIDGERHGGETARESTKFRIHSGYGEFRVTKKKERKRTFKAAVTLFYIMQNTWRFPEDMMTKLLADVTQAFLKHAFFVLLQTSLRKVFFFF